MAVERMCRRRWPSTMRTQDTSQIEGRARSACRSASPRPRNELGGWRTADGAACETSFVQNASHAPAWDVSGRRQTPLGFHAAPPRRTDPGSQWERNAIPCRARPVKPFRPRLSPAVVPFVTPHSCSRRCTHTPAPGGRVPGRGIRTRRRQGRTSVPRRLIPDQTSLVAPRPAWITASCTAWTPARAFARSPRDKIPLLISYWTPHLHR